MPSFLGRSRDGNIAISFAVIAPLIMIAAGFGIDFQGRLAQRAALQAAADNLALRGAREMLLENTSEAQVEALIEAVAQKQYGEALGAYELDPEVDDEAKVATVRIAQAGRKGFFLPQFFHSGVVEAQATAQARGVTNVCVIALEDDAGDAVRAETAAKLDAADCAILSNSTASTGINVSGLAKLTADFICSSGGASGGTLNFSPLPVTDCPVYADPLADRVAPDASGCDHSDLKIESGGTVSLLASVVETLDGSLTSTLPGYARHDLYPGVYCGGLEIEQKSDVHLAPGVYVIKDGPLKIAYGARLYGRNVGFYLDGDASTFLFEPESIINLTAPADGLMAGLLFFESRDAPEGRSHRIRSSNARELLGTIYLPRGELEVDSLQAIADQSAYTAIVAHRLRLKGSPTLVLNADYAATDIPVPDGIGPTGGEVFLRD